MIENHNSILERMAKKFSPDPSTGCWIWHGAKSRGGYGNIRFNNKNYRAHRLMWEIINQQTIDQGKVACHTCDNPRCVNPDHIFLGTQKENMQDKCAKGRASGGAQGMRHNSSKLTDENVIEIFSSDESTRQLAKRFPVNHATISKIKAGKLWTHITRRLTETLSESEEK